MDQSSHQTLLLLEQLEHLFALKQIELIEEKMLEIICDSLHLNGACLLKIYDGQSAFCCISHAHNDQHDCLLHCPDSQLQPVERLPDRLNLPISVLSRHNRLHESVLNERPFYMLYVDHSRDSNDYILFTSRHSLAITEKHLLKSIMGLCEKHIKVLESSQIDTLTGLLNRVTLDDNLFKIQNLYHSEQQKALQFTGANQRTELTDSDYYLGLIDIDFFKRINDTFGHVYGDEVLLLVAQLMRNTFRAEDLLFRIGGEEFVVIIKAEKEEIATQVFERFRQVMADFHFPQLDQVTVSIGITHLSRFYHIPEAIIDRADKALYYAKEHGRNQMHFYERLMTEGKITSTLRHGDIDYF